MNITVYCGLALGDDPAFAQAAHELGAWISRNGHRLVYGGAQDGLMGIIADAVLHDGGEVIGVLPEVLIEREPPHEGLTEFILVKTMAQRKAKMIELGDVFVAMPGGPGTLEEVSEIMSLGKMGMLPGRCVLLNVKGYFDALVEVYDRMHEHGFMDAENRGQLASVSTVKELSKWLG